MNRSLYTLTLTATLLLLSACGGGGGASTTGTSGGPTGDQSWLTFTPNTVAINTNQGQSVAFSVSAKSSKTIPVKFNVGIIEKLGLITTQVNLVELSPYEYRADMHTSPTLAAGAHATQLEVRLCEDDPLVCNKPISGSPFFVPLTVTVAPPPPPPPPLESNLTPLTPLPQLGAWGDLGGGAAHTGYVNASFNPAKFTVRWWYSLPPVAAGDNHSGTLNVLTNNGLVYLVHDDLGAQNSSVLALDEASGQVRWNRQFSGITVMGTLSGGNIYVVGDNGPGSILRTLNAQTGQDGINTTVPLQASSVYGPLVSGNNIYASFGTLGSQRATLARFDAIAGGLVTTTQLADLHGKLAADSRYVYSASGRGLTAFDLASGAIAFTLDDSDIPQTSDTPGYAPVLGDHGLAYALHDGTLIAYDTAARSRAWKVSGHYVEQPALANGIVYAWTAAGNDASGNPTYILRAHSAATGELLWSSASGAYASKDMIVTNNLLFATGAQTVAFDLSTHQVVWSKPFGGPMALSDRGVLYIAGGTNPEKVLAINLQ
jgi:hypothetical protein